METNIIKSFSVYGLFGVYDVHIPFSKNIKILVGENGLGKTQVLNLLYHTLTRNFFKLNEYNFHKLAITFFDNESLFHEKKIEILKKDINNWIENVIKDPIVKDIIETFGFEQFKIMKGSFNQNNNQLTNIHKQLILNDKIRRRYSTSRIISALENIEIAEFQSANSVIETHKKEIAHHLQGIDIMYFPTFRRVEEDLHNLGYNEEDFLLNQENTLIQFGMDDVQKRFKKVEDEIETLLKEGLSVFLKDVLKIVMSKNIAIDDSIFERINEDDLAIIFARAKNLDPEIKEAVLNSVRSKEFNDPLSGLILQKLVELYENQKEYDNAIILFRNVCNKYLINKKVFYDESKIKIYIKSDLTDEEIQLKHLSSGEKQIISIFSKVYLSEADKRFMVLFDEPELSLSIKWQSNLLPDIIKSGKCVFLLAVTHSPFIFDSEVIDNRQRTIALDNYAVGLDQYIEYITPSLNPIEV